MSAESTRRLLLLRHAKAEWSDGDDHERPLAERGRKDAPVAGRWITGSGVVLDRVLCSTAVRCRETWKLASSELGQRPRTVFEDRLYEAPLGEMIVLLNEVDDDVRDLALVGHHPGIHALADALAGEVEGDLLPRMNRTGFPTSAIAVVTFTGSWKTLEHGAGTLAAFWSPHA